MGFDLVSRILFPTPPSSYDVDSFPEELIWVPKNLDPTSCSPEDCVPCLFLPYSSARFLIFYLHSNAEDLGRCYSFCCSHRAQFQVHVLAVEYPGYGICPGGPCDEHRVTENAFAAFRFVREVIGWPLDSILILGRSIGCGPAISLAVRYQVSGVITVSPMLSVREVIKDVLGPLAQVIDERFPNKERVQLIRSPLLVVHGQKDMMIPCRHGVDLYGVCRSRKLLICPKDMEHNTNLLANVTYFVLPMLQFFSLPDYCFDDIQVPSWAYDKRLSPFHNRATPSQQLPWGRTLSRGEGDEKETEEISAAASFNRWLFGTTAPPSSASDANATPSAAESATSKEESTSSVIGSTMHLSSSSAVKLSRPLGIGAATAAQRQNQSSMGLAGPGASGEISRPGFKVVPPPDTAFSDPVPPPPFFGGSTVKGNVTAMLPSQQTSRGTSDTADRSPSRSGTLEQASIPTPPWGPSMAPSEPSLVESGGVPMPPSPPRPPSPSSSVKLLSPVDLVEIVEDLERHFETEGFRCEKAGKNKTYPTLSRTAVSAPCTPTAEWRELLGEPAPLTGSDYKQESASVPPAKAAIFERSI